MITRAAEFSKDCTYRYLLSRDWAAETLDEPDAPAATVLFVMLNPSTANAAVDDPTIRRCMGFARTWGFTRLEVVNAFAYRATKPADLAAAHRQPDVDVVGPDNLWHVGDAVKRADLVIAAWGASYPHSLRSHISEVRKHLVMTGAKCLGYTSTDEPRHPLYVPGTADPVDLIQQRPR